jgi:hypothetical protein
VNGNYVGNAPCTVEVSANAEGRFRERTTIRAFPTREGDFEQIKSFHSYGFEVHNFSTQEMFDKVPQRVFFDMRLGPVTPKIDVNIR